MKHFGYFSGVFATLMLAGCQHFQTPHSEVYQAIVDAHKGYGATPTHWAEQEFQTTQIQPCVILAPLYKPEHFAPYVKRVRKVASGRFPVYELETWQDQRISFIQVGVGACNTLDAVLALSGTPCRQILFVGSVGSLSTEASLGDIIIPQESVCGCGADAYLTTGNFLKNSSLGKTYAADRKSAQKLRKIAQNVVLNASLTPNIRQDRVFSIDTVLGEYHHLPTIQKLGCQAIEMETATLFHVAQVIGRDAVALLYVSDCTLKGQSLYYGRNEDVIKRKDGVKDQIIPQVILKYFLETPER